MTNLDSILKSRDITLPTKVHRVKTMVFRVVMYGCESWTIKKAGHQRIDAFELQCYKRLLRVPWIARKSNLSTLKEISPKYSLEGLMLKLQYFGHRMRRTDSLEKTLMLGKIEARRRREWDGWMASPTWWTWVWASSWSWWWTGKPGMLQSMESQRVRHDWMTELNWIILPHSSVCVCVCVCVCACVLSCVQLFSTPWTVAHQAPLSMDFLGKNTGAGCHFLLQGSSWPRDGTQVSCIASWFFIIWAPRKINIFPNIYVIFCLVFVCFFGDQPNKLNLPSAW